MRSGSQILYMSYLWPASFSTLSDWLVYYNFFMPRLYDAAILDSYVYIIDEMLQYLIIYIDERERDPYLFLQIASIKYQISFNYWLHHGADLRYRTAGVIRIGSPWSGRGFRMLGRNFAILDAFSMVFLAVACFLSRGWSWTWTCTFSAGFIGEKSVRRGRDRKIITSFSTQQEVFANFACKLDWIEELTGLMAFPGSLIWNDES